MKTKKNQTENLHYITKIKKSFVESETRFTVNKFTETVTVSLRGLNNEYPLTKNIIRQLSATIAEQTRLTIGQVKEYIECLADGALDQGFFYPAGKQFDELVGSWQFLKVVDNVEAACCNIDFGHAVPHQNITDKELPNITTLVSALLPGIQPTHHEFQNMFLGFKLWGAGLLASHYGQISPYAMILSGPKGCGKTRFFDDLLPSIINNPEHIGRCAFNPKDPSFLEMLGRKFLVIDNDIDSFSGYDSHIFKGIMTNRTVDVRQLYHEKMSVITRKASIAGTTERTDILEYGTTNRRTFVFRVKSIDFDKLNGIDRLALFKEFERLQAGTIEIGDNYCTFDNCSHIKEFQELMSYIARNFQKEKPYKPVEGDIGDLITSLFSVPKEDEYQHNVNAYSAKQVSGILEKNGFGSVSPVVIGRALSVAGFQRREKRNGSSSPRYFVCCKQKNIDYTLDIE